MDEEKRLGHEVALPDNVLERYKRHLTVRQLSPHTIRNYLNDIKTFITYISANGAVSIKNPTRRTLRGYVARLREEGYATPSIIRKTVALRSFYKFIKDAGLSESDNIDQIPAVKRDKRLPRDASVKEIEALMDAPDVSRLQGLRDRALLETIYAGGLRVSEAHGLDIADISLEEREVRVTGKGYKQRIVFIGREAAFWLNRYLAEARPQWAGARSGSALFLNQRAGSRLSVRSIQVAVKRYAIKAGLSPDIHTHTLRHSFATHILSGGSELRTVQELLGHSNLETTQIYTHISSAEAREAYLENHPRSMVRKGDDQV